MVQRMRSARSDRRRATRTKAARKIPTKRTGVCPELGTSIGASVSVGGGRMLVGPEVPDDPAVTLRLVLLAEQITRAPPPLNSRDDASSVDRCRPLTI
jgi:hypothetical protein